MLCGAVTARGKPCQCSGSTRVGSLRLCWQHARELEEHYRLAFDVRGLERRIDSLETAIMAAQYEREDQIAAKLAAGVACDEPCVYIAESPLVPGLVKIGYSTDLRSRMRSLDARALVAIPGTRDDETRMHRRFGHLRCRFEWFYRAGDLAEFIEAA